MITITAREKALLDNMESTLQDDTMWDSAEQQTDDMFATISGADTDFLFGDDEMCGLTDDELRFIDMEQPLFGNDDDFAPFNSMDW